MNGNLEIFKIIIQILIMSSDVLEIYINSRSATQIYNNLISDAMQSLPDIEINKNEKAYICVKNAVIPNSFYNINNSCFTNYLYLKFYKIIQEKYFKSLRTFCLTGYL